MNYLDTSALLKLLFREDETDALQRWVAAVTAVTAQRTTWVTSELSQVEVLRATRRLDARVLPAARDLLGRLDLVPLSGAVLEVAGELPGPALRSLDALHLASALALAPDLAVFVAYDLRLAAAARDEGLEVEHPGA